MGFFGTGKTTTQSSTDGIPLSLLHKQQCKVCPLDKLKSALRHPHMKPYGTESPVLYFLGEAPGKTEDRLGKPFVGNSGECLRFRIPEKWLAHIRWNNCVRTRPPGNRTPSQVEIECCRPSITEDIERTKPKAIFGFGNVPLYWALNRTGITNWSGRRMPIKVGNHACWFFPLMHPSYVLRDPKRKEWFVPRKQSDYGSDLEFVFALHLKNAFNQIDSLPEPVVHTVEYAKKDVKIVTGESRDDLSTVVNFIRGLYDRKYVGVDYETRRKRPYADDAKILSIGLSSNKGTLAFPLHHREAKWSIPDIDFIYDEYKRFLLKAPCRKISHNLMFEMEWTAHEFGKECLRAQPWEDTISQAYTLDEKQRGTKDLDFLCLQYFGINLKAISNLNRDNLDNEPLPLVLKYNGIDSKYHRLLYYAQSAEIGKEQDLIDVYDHQLRRVPTMVLTQIKGIPVDQTRTAELEKEFEGKLKDIENRVSSLPDVRKYNKATGQTFRPSANKDVHRILHGLGFHPESVDEEELSKIDHPIAKLVLEWRGINKQLSTYIKPFKTGAKDLHPDGLLHPMLNPGKTETWRTSSDSPNSQNVSKHEYKEVRSQVKIPGEVYKVVSFDYAGIQARNVAMESMDKNLVDAFWHDYDIHTDWALETIGLYPRWFPGGMKGFRAADKSVQKEYRQRAKNSFVFPSFFGAQPPNISRGLEIPIKIAEKLQNRFWGKFPGIYDWHERLKKDYYKTGYVTGLSRFRRRAPVSHNQLINSPIQSDEAVIVCTAMSELSELEQDRYQANMEIHDDLTFLWHKKQIERNAEVVAKIMTKINFPWINVPIGIEMSVGDDWASTKEVAKYSSIELWGHKRA